MFRRLCAVACILFVFAMVVHAAEPMPGTPAAEVAADAVEDGAVWWLGMAESGLNWLWKITIPAFFVWLIKKAGDSEALKNALRALEAGVNDAWVHFVKDLKIKAKDGKLTPDEKVAARDWATNKARDIASGPGKKVLLALGRMGVDSLIEKIVARKKAGG